MDSTSDENPYAPPPVPDADRPPPHSPKDADGLTSPPQPHLGWALLVVLGFFLFQALAGVAIAVIGIAAMGMQFLQSPLGGQLLIVSASAATCIYAVGVVAAVYGREAVRRVALRWPSLWQTVLVALLFLPLAVVVSEINNWLIPYVPSFAMELMANLAEMPLPAIVVGMCLFPAVGEELLFRGFIGRGLVGRYGPAAGVVMTSLIFGFIHIDPLQSISACLLGGALHYVYLTTKSLAAPMLLHFFNNLAALLAMRFSDRFPIPGLSAAVENGEVVHTPAGMMAVSCILVAVLGVLFYQSRSHWRTKDGSRWNPPYVTAEAPPDAAARPYAAPPHALLLAAAVVLFGGLVWLLQLAIQQWAG